MKIAAACLALLLLSIGLAQDPTRPERIAEMERSLAALQDQLSDLHHREGVEAFMEGRMKESVASFDRCIELAPAREPHHWQRGLAHYYAEMYQAGVEQFVSHQDVNGTDVENAVWHYLCLSKLKGPAHAKSKIYPFAGDARVPMKEVHALFAGTGDEAAVLKSAEATKSKNDLCFAHLYLGLWHEAHGREDKAKHHIKLATIDYRMTHYMGEVARIHWEQRWKKK